MIHELRNIGLSDLEARCYMVLHEEPKISGYEVAKKVSVSRTNVYAALRSLTDKGVCRTIETDPVLYDAVPIRELIRQLKSDFEQTAQTLLEKLHAPPKASYSFYSWQGEEPIRTAIQRIIANADKTVIVDIWAEDIHWVENYLLEAENRGVAVTLISIGNCHTRLKHVLVHRRSEEWINVASRKFSILVDSRSALLGSFGHMLKTTVVETDHPSLIELLQNEFYHDIIMERIEQDFNHELVKKYGNHYEHIIQQYKEYF